ncbi:hypothetical protein [Pedobacter sp. Hv1]|uniref:hypothetical protein n=1 Tax=Pedobacter sp. Hv1 TaxID=1740090 RepID=UPI000AFE9ECF|nr:hypothetical protein [Pedobacter sp. Hv1]
MKTILTLCISILCGLSANAQKSDSTQTHYRLIRGGFVEHSTELKSKKGIKNGEARIENGKKIVAKGLYKDGERIDRWQFFKEGDTLEQIYNYSIKRMEYNQPHEKIRFEIDSLKEGDRVVYPAKIGGTNYALMYLLKKYSMPYELQNKVGEYLLSFIFNIDSNGKLVKYQIRVGNNNFNKLQEVDLKKLNPEDLEFTAARLNGRNVGSTLIFETKLTIDR